MISSKNPYLFDLVPTFYLLQHVRFFGHLKLFTKVITQLDFNALPKTFVRRQLVGFLPKLIENSHMAPKNKLDYSTLFREGR